ncbi:MAG: hypothetical protein RIS79_3510 [Verrucomicrobiota bacterium]
MADQNTEAAAKLEKLGARLRQAVAAQHPTQERDIQTALGAVREQWEQEQEALRQKKPAPGKGPQREPEPPEADR